MDFVDKVITCRACGQPFNFGIGEQMFFRDKELRDPLTCPSCREARRQRGGDREWHIGQCAQCGGAARVPFVPAADRLIYCSDCFGQRC